MSRNSGTRPTRRFRWWWRGFCSPAIFGAAIGFEREWRNRPAGLRTHILVCVAAATFAILTIEIIHAPMFTTDELKDAVKVDPVRVVEAVTAGVAFLAAGVVIFTRGAGAWADHRRRHVARRRDRRRLRARPVADRALSLRCWRWSCSACSTPSRASSTSTRARISPRARRRRTEDEQTRRQGQGRQAQGGQACPLVFRFSSNCENAPSICLPQFRSQTATHFCWNCSSGGFAAGLPSTVSEPIRIWPFAELAIADIECFPKRRSPANGRIAFPCA